MLTFTTKRTSWFITSQENFLSVFLVVYTKEQLRLKLKTLNKTLDFTTILCTKWDKSNIGPSTRDFFHLPHQLGESLHQKINSFFVEIYFLHSVVILHHKQKFIRPVCYYSSVFKGMWLQIFHQKPSSLRLYGIQK